MSGSPAAYSHYSAKDVNPHYLKRIAILSGDGRVQTREDVFDQHGIKILHRGSVVDESVCERLLRYKLAKPIESMLGVEDGVAVSELVNLADELLAVNRGLARTLASVKADLVAINLVKQLKLDGTSRLMLSLHKQDNVKLRHAMLVALLAVGMAHNSGLSDEQLLALVAAGVLHDVGEYYIDPSFFSKGPVLSPSEWKHIACHPLIGEMVIRETMSFPRETSRFVAEHHERLNGYGYPRLFSGGAISAGGVCLGVAEVIAGIIGREGNDFYRIGNALKLIPGEFPKVTVSLIENTYRAMRDELGFPVESLQATPLVSRVNALSSVLEASLEWVEKQNIHPDDSNGVRRFVRERLLHLQQAAYSVGMLSGGERPFAIDEFLVQEQFEVHSACQEIFFRIKELFYVASLHHDCDAETQSFVSGLGDCLSEQSQAAMSAA